MPRKIITYIVFFVFLHLIGCYSTNFMPYPEFEEMLLKNNQPKEYYIITKNAQRYHIAAWNIMIDEDSVFINGTLDFGEYEEPFIGKIAVEDIEAVEVESADKAVATTFLIVSVIGVTALLIALSSNSGKNHSSSSGSGGCSYDISGIFSGNSGY